MELDLRIFNDSPSDHKFSITASIEFYDEKLVVESVCQGPINDLIYDEGLKGLHKQLWKQSCFEFFYFEDKNSSKYYEWNFSPSKAHQLLHFNDYRIASTAAIDSVQFESSWEQGEEELKVKTTIHSPLQKKPELVNVTWVLKTKSGLSYWAVQHPDDSPDFHQKALFVEL